MTEFRIPACGWIGALADALHVAQPGDTITVLTEPMLRLAETAAQRMGKEDVILKVEEE